MIKRNKKGQFVKGCAIQTTHGMAKTRFNNIWHGVLQRCNNSNNPAYIRYGGRGIKCLWKSFDKFKTEMYESYLEHVKKFGEKQTQIDRMDNNGNYCKENCLWVDFEKQARNKRNNHSITFQGKTMCIREWEDKLGFNSGTLWARLNQLNWSVEKALTTPLLRQSKI